MNHLLSFFRRLYGLFVCPGAAPYVAGAPSLPPPELGLRFVPCTTVSGHCILPAVPAILASAPAQPLYAAFCDLPPPPGGWELLISPAVVPDAAFR